MRIVEQTESNMVVRSSPSTMLLAGLLLLLPGVLLLTHASGRLVVLLLSLAFIAAGLLYLLSAKRGTVVVDKLRSTVSITSRSLLKGDNRSVAIADVERITTDQLYKRPGRQWNVWSNSILVLKDGSYVALDREHGRTATLPDGTAFTKLANRTVETALAAFLGVPLVVNPTWDEAMGAWRQARAADRQRHTSAAPTRPSAAEGRPSTAAVPAQWFPDPAGRHDHRYWDGCQWTAYVANRGEQSVDPLPEASPAATV